MPVRLFGHTALFLEADSASRIVSVEDNPELRRPRGCPRNSWLRSGDWSLEGFGMGREDACRLAWGIVCSRGVVIRVPTGGSEPGMRVSDIITSGVV